MKKLKMKLLICLFLGLSVFVKAQNLQTVKVYYDYSKTRLSEIYTVIANTGTKQGLYKSYDKDGTLVLERTFKNNIENGISKEYFSAGKAFLNKNGKIELQGKLYKTFTYENGILNGVCKVYQYDTGKQMIQFESVFSNNVMIKQTEYHLNGRKKTFEQLNGLCNIWYETGEIGAEYTSVNNISVGLFTSWYKNGKMEFQGNYNEKGKEQGIWKKWDEKGNLISEILFENGIDVEKEKAKESAQEKLNAEAREKRQKEEKENILKYESEQEQKKLQQEKQRKEFLLEDKIKETNEKSKQVKLQYVVIDEIQTSLFDKQIYKIKKKNLYEAFIILKNEFTLNINKTQNVDEKLLLVESYNNLLNKVILLSEQNTKELEKELKGVEDVQKIMEIFKL